MGMVNGGGSQRLATQVSAWPRKETNSKSTAKGSVNGGAVNGHSVPAFGPDLNDPLARTVRRSVLSRELRDELTDLRGELDRLLRPGQDRVRGRLEALETRLEHACKMAHGPEVGAEPVGLAQLRACLQSFAEAFSKHAGIPCHVVLNAHPPGEAEPRFDKERVDVLRAILRETMANVERHAHADAVEIQLSTNADGLRITVSDDGWGLCPAAALYPRQGGVARMHADARACGGHLEIDTPERGGTRVTCSVPAAAALTSGTP